MPATRLLRVDDVAVLADLQRAHRDFLAPWEPLRADDYFTLQVVRPIQRDGALGPGDRRTAALRAPGALPTLAG